MRYSLYAWLVLLFANANVDADIAVDRQGEEHRGELVQDAAAWTFRGDDSKQVPITQIAYIRFSPTATPLAQNPITHTLHLPYGQQVSGRLRQINAKNVEFTPSWGKKVQLARSSVIGVEQARSGRILLYDPLDESLESWQLLGKSRLDRGRAFHGAASLLLDQPKQTASRTWKSELTDGNVRLYYYDSADAKTLASFEVIANQPVTTLTIDAAHYACDKQREAFGAVKRTPGWHQLDLELRSGRLRVYVDDSCLGEVKANVVTGIRVTNKAGKIWIDELLVTQRLPHLPIPASAKDRDTLWLTHGEELFGQLLHADQEAATLDSKLGKRTIPWSQLRGIFFAQSKPSNETHEPEISFRPGPGFPLDQLRGKLLRWEKDHLIVQHDLLGEITLDRARLEKIRWLTK